ncbi:DUF559 domain-containing protein [Pseudomarimonas arenosa]|uniref:Endonuclease domain-containing protein n=1 Tax=Pseudomarimonas arenosa TaxID=2774145 RepID=A0AAW3ZLD4_9GAMM|nr:endonuclease domain-containing protein [Pseudomarimonas arenosa]
MRRTPTDAESELWFLLRDGRVIGQKFRRQVPMGHYIADFVCHECHLIVEVDGGQHSEARGYDAARDAWFRESGYRVLRYWNDEVLKSTERVLEDIVRHLES